MADALKQFWVGVAEKLLPFWEIPGATDLVINGTESLFLETDGTLTPHANPFREKGELMDLVERLVVPTGKRIDASRPYLDGRLPDGSRFHIILPPVAPHGPLISIRKFPNRDRLTLADFGSRETIGWITEQVRARKNILICGGTGTGKTTFLSKLLTLVPETERVLIIEESREIFSSHPHAVFLEARPPTPDGIGEITLRALIRQSLRMRPDRIILGECRGEEAFEMLQAMSTGHPGSLSTLHASSALDALKRLEVLLALGRLSLSFSAIRHWVASAIDLVVFLQRRGGKRLIIEMIEVCGLEGEVYRTRPCLTVATNG